MSTAANDDGVGRVYSPETLAAYVRGELSPARVAQVEGYLACNPDLAAQVMAGLHRSRRVRPLRGLNSRRVASMIAGLGLLAAGMGVGFAAAPGEGSIFGPPEYVEDAVMASRALARRAVMRSQPETPHLDSAEIAAATRVRLPDLPAGWRLRDVQVFPADAGLAVGVLMTDEQGDALNLFAVEAGSRADATPDVVKLAGEHVAYWEIGEAAYALTGEASTPAELIRQAGRLSRSRLL